MVDKIIHYFVNSVRFLMAILFVIILFVDTLDSFKDPITYTKVHTGEVMVGHGSQSLNSYRTCNYIIIFALIIYLALLSLCLAREKANSNSRHLKNIFRILELLLVSYFISLLTITFFEITF